MYNKLLTIAILLGLTLSAHAALAEDAEGVDSDAPTTGTNIVKPLPIKVPTLIMERERQMEENKVGQQELEAGQAERKAEMETKRVERQAELQGKQDERAATMIERSRERAKQMLEKIKKQMERLRERVQSAKQFGDEGVASVAAKIDSEIMSLEGLKERVGEIQNRDELKPLTEEMRAEIKKVRSFSGIYNAHLLLARLSKLIDRTGSKIETIETKIAEITAGGTDTSSLAPLLSDAKLHLDEAQNIFATTKTGLEAAIAAGEMQSIRDSAMRAKEITTHIIASHKSLQSLIPAINLLVRPAPVEATTTVEEEQQ